MAREGSAGATYHLHPHYRAQRPLDAKLLLVEPGHDEFSTEKYAAQIADVLATWSASLLGSSDTNEAVKALASSLADDFGGSSWHAAESRTVRADALLEIRDNRSASEARLDREAFLREVESALAVFTKITLAEFQLTAIEAGGKSSTDPSIPPLLWTTVRYEIAGTGAAFHREQWVGEWELEWKASAPGGFLVSRWRGVEETRVRARSPIYADITEGALGGIPSYSAQLQHGTDYWRTILDGACGIDIYGHNGVSVADIDNDGFDDIYVCQPAGLPNRLYRNRGDGTFEDVTEASGLGILENTACALFADFNNDGRQDVIVVKASGPALFLNEADGRFREKKDVFRFANPPRGTFTGAAVADYDRDGWLDIYFCLYSYYQGTGQYKYPSPYHDAENGPPNFLMRNQRDGTFRDVTAESGLNRNNTRYSFCCGWSDYNRDGWPDLYVVNDFGRKNLYRNNGDGTFTDVAAEAGVEDIGAGMSESWFASDNGGREDLYVANMWTAAGERIATQDTFKKDSPEAVRKLYRKHAMGNSLFRNRSREGEAKFENVTSASHVGMGRWSWASDAFDFDHDGFMDLYVTNGMVSGPEKNDLNSFFWRQVVARSPDDARASKEYEAGWNAINELIRADGTWSGYERNVFYANNGDGTFSDVSAVVGLDFVEDGRAFALADLDGDGRLEIVVKNRNAPQLRILKNVMAELPPSISFRLRGIKSNRDAIGAVVTIETEHGRQTRELHVGSGFLSQHSKEILFGLGDAKGTVRVTIRWPSGAVQELGEVAANHRIWVDEGANPTRMEPFKNTLPVASASAKPVDAIASAEEDPETIETWLLAPYPAPEFSLPDAAGKTRTLAEFRGKPVLVSLWNAGSPDFEAYAQGLTKNSPRWQRLGFNALAVIFGGDEPAAPRHVRSLPYVVLRGGDDVAAVYDIVYRQLFDRHRDLTLPTSFLIDGKGEIVKVYQGALDPPHVEHDFQNIPRIDAERLARALPFPGTGHTLEFGRNYLSIGALFFQRGYLDEAGVAFQRALKDDPASAEALYGIGSVYLDQNKNAEARAAFERAVKLEPGYPDTLPDAWNNLGVIATREGRMEESIPCFERALEANPHHLLALDNLGNAYRLEKRWDAAETILERALAVDAQDADANYSLGMVFAQNGENDKAYEYLQRALRARPDYPEALNNLGVLYIVTQRRDEAVASFEQCIRVAPGFDQAYLNLARVYALEGARDKSRGVLEDLLRLHPEHEQAKQMLEQLQK